MSETRAPSTCWFCDRVVWPGLGLLLVVGLWWLAVHGLGRDSLMAARFSPENTGLALLELASAPDIWRHALASLQRVAFGLGIALLVGVPLGLLVGSWPGFNRLSSTTFQFLRMISPLSWMPIAVMALGIGEAPVVFLIVFAAVWPIVLNVAAGIQAIDPQWLTLADSLGANRRERLWHVTVPAIASPDCVKTPVGAGSGHWRSAVAGRRQREIEGHGLAIRPPATPPSIPSRPEDSLPF